ncbi:MAG: iron ABC transporter permease [Alphaproteobacteria bacterium]|nr:iron ABC transporter permease [Alphaproteobacteria bacterium]
MAELALAGHGDGRRSRLVWGLILLAATAAVTLGPILVVIEGGASEEGAWRSVIHESAHAHAALGYSVLFAARAPFAALIGFFIAWLLIRVPIPGRSFIEFMFWIAFFLPLIPVTLGWMLVLDDHNGLLNTWLKDWFALEKSVFEVNSIGGIFWVHMTASSVPVMIILLGPAIRQMDGTLEDAGRVCGSGALQVFRRITLPLLVPAILTGTILGFIRGLEAFEVEQLLGAPERIYVYSTHVYALVNWEPPRFGEAMALSTLVLFVLLVLALIYQRYTAARSYATITGSGLSVRQFSIGRWRWALSALFMAVIALIVLVPMGFLALGTAMTLFGFFDLDEPFTWEYWRIVLGDANFVPAVFNTLILGLGAAAIGVFAYAGLAYAIQRTRVALRPLTDFLAWLPWCVPGILLGVGLLTLVLFTPALTPFYGSIGLLIFAISVSQLPLGVSMMKTSVAQIGVELEQASQVCGAARLRTFRRVVLPLMKPMLISMFVLVTIAGIRDVSTVLLLAQPSSLPLSVLMLEYANNGDIEMAACVGVVTAAMVVAVAVVARRFGLQIGQAR